MHWLAQLSAGIMLFFASFFGPSQPATPAVQPAVPSEKAAVAPSDREVAVIPTPTTGFGYAAIKNQGVFCDGEKLPGADSETFTVLEGQTDHISADDWVARYAVDKHSVYANCSKFSGADRATFKLILTPTGDFTGYVADAGHVWWLPQDANAVPVSDDPAHFKVLNGYFATMHDAGNHVSHERAEGFAEDARSLFYEDKELAADRATFMPLASSSTPYAKDKNHIYFQNAALPGADISTFSVDPCESYGVECFGAVDAADKDHQYAYGEIVK